MNPGSHLETGPPRRLFLRLAVAAGLLAALFAWPLFRLVSFALHSELFSYILLIPVISGYLIWSVRNTLNLQAARPCWTGALLAFAAGGAALAAYALGRRAGWEPAAQDYLSLMTLAFVCCLWGVCLVILGSRLPERLHFPLAFLLFAVPLPRAWQDHIDTFFQYKSAAMAEAFCKAAFEPVARNGLILRLSHCALRVNPECSGIHSTLVLLIVGFLAGFLFLRRFWTRAALVLAVVPLAILRNGFRVFVIGWLCVHVSPDMIDSPIHHHGGPIFFALSLIPFFLLLVFLRKWESHARVAEVPNTQSKERI